MIARLAWARDGRDWPNRDASRFISVDGLAWHVQVMGKGPVLLLLHGAGASSHSWRDLMPLLAADFQVIAPDLPGQGFSAMPHGSGFSIEGMANAMAALLKTLGAVPKLIVGHSAGAAVAVRMVLDGLARPSAIIGINAALLPFHSGSAIFSGLAKLFAANPLVPWFFAHQARSPRVIERLLDDTGSRLDERGASLYKRLAENSAHVSGTLRMMANWDLETLRRELPGLDIPLYLLTGLKDGTVPPARAHDIRKLLPETEIVPFRGLGHLAHEEDPAAFAEGIRTIAGRYDMIAGSPHV